MEIRLALVRQLTSYSFQVLDTKIKLKLTKHRGYMQVTRIIKCKIYSHRNKITIHQRVYYVPDVVFNFLSLQSTDEMLVHLQSFSSNSSFYTIPESTKNGVPLFYLPPNSNNPVSNVSTDILRYT